MRDDDPAVNRDPSVSSTVARDVSDRWLVMSAVADVQFDAELITNVLGDSVFSSPFDLLAVVLPDHDGSC